MIDLDTDLSLEYPDLSGMVRPKIPLSSQIEHYYGDYEIEVDLRCDEVFFRGPSGALRALKEDGYVGREFMDLGLALRTDRGAGRGWAFEVLNDYPSKHNPRPRKYLKVLYPSNDRVPLILYFMATIPVDLEAFLETVGFQNHTRTVISVIATADTIILDHAPDQDKQDKPEPSETETTTPVEASTIQQENDHEHRQELGGQGHSDPDRSAGGDGNGGTRGTEGLQGGEAVHKGSWLDRRARLRRDKRK